MNTLKKLSVENDKLVWELRFVLAYHLGWKLNTINSFIETQAEKVNLNLKNFWLQKREKKEQLEEHHKKLDQIARFVTKYISNYKSQCKG